MRHVQWVSSHDTHFLKYLALSQDVTEGMTRAAYPKHDGFSAAGPGHLPPAPRDGRGRALQGPLPAGC